MLDSKISYNDIRVIARYMREADRQEVMAASGLTPLQVLEAGIKDADLCGVLRSPTGYPVAIMGVVSLSPTTGGIWLLGTDGIVLHKRMLHKLAKVVIAKLHTKWPRLTNMVDARNTIHIRWLKAMGFTFGEPVIAGVAKIPFIPFYRDSKNV